MKIAPECDVFSVIKATNAEAKCVGKVVGGNCIKRGCHLYFVAEKPYLDHSLYMLVYENIMHVNTRGQRCHG